MEWGYVFAGIAIGTGIMMHAMILRDTVYRIAKKFYTI